MNRMGLNGYPMLRIRLRGTRDTTIWTTWEYIIMKFQLHPMMANSARHNSNLNNEYVVYFQDSIRERQNEGYVDCEYYVGWVNYSEERKALAAATAVCNRTEFQGVEYSYSFEDDEPDEDGERDLTIEFSW